jgi:aminopeptidase N
VANEPQGVPSWMPVNDSLKDFATWDFTVTVPKGRTVMANGILVSKTDSGDRTTWHWHESSPMVSYLATVTNGVFELRTGTLANGLPRYDAVDPQTRYYGEKTPRPQDAWDSLSIEPEAIDFLSSLYGPYSFESVGGIVDWAPNVFYALETQTKPNYDVLPDKLTVVHELAHQWFGDTLVLDHWSDMWLNEGFATWSEWIWTERHGGQTAQQRFDELYAVPESGKRGQDLWFPAPDALPGPADLFGTPVYDRGAMTLQALRAKVGDTTFLNILRTWYAEHQHSNVTTPQFIATAERVSGRQLDHFFDVWLFQEGRPEPGSW